MNPNILFIVIDSLRADKTYDDKKTSITPYIDSLIKNGTYFTQAIAPADGTILSLNGILNGLYPFSTGIRSKKIILKDNNLLQLCKNNSYHIYGFLPKLTSFQPIISWCENNDNTYEAGPPTIPLSKTAKQIINLFDSNKMLEPWFYFLHIFDLHTIREGTIPNWLDHFDDEKFGQNKYERIVSLIDFWIGKILDKIDLKKTLIILTADHGERIPIDDKNITSFEPELSTTVKLGKQILPQIAHKAGGKFLSKLRKTVGTLRVAQANKNLTSYEKRSRLPHFTLSLYDESIRVPLLFSGYNISSKIIIQQVSTVDIFPTIIDLLQSQSSFNFDGTSLFPFFNGKQISEKPVYLHTMPYEHLSSCDAVGIRTSHYKYFRHSREPTKIIYLFDLKNDPLENQNIAKENPNVIVEMENMLSNMHKIDNDNKNMLSEEERKIAAELKKLGYM